MILSDSEEEVYHLKKEKVVSPELAKSISMEQPNPQDIVRENSIGKEDNIMQLQFSPPSQQSL